jgi:Galactose oxidase, central domain/Kelch motif
VLFEMATVRSVDMRARAFTICATAFALVLVACNGDGSSGNESSARSRSGTTTEGPPMPDERTEVAGAFWDGKIAVAGGLIADSSTDRLDLFDLSRGTWSTGPPLPHQYDHASLAELGGRLYLVGGYLSELSNPTDEVWSLGPGDNTWTREPVMSTRRGALATASAAGTIVAIGGVDGAGTVLRTTEIFTPGTGWAAGPNLSIPREHLGAAGAGDKVYAIAGRNAQGATTSVESLAVGGGQWTAEPMLRDERSGNGGATTDSGRICTGGGEVPGAPDTVRTIECLDQGGWERVTTMRVPRHGLAVVAEGNRIHFVSGGPEPGGSFSDAHEVLEA